MTSLCECWLALFDYGIDDLRPVAEATSLPECAGKRLYPFPAPLPLGSHSENQKTDLQDRLGILAL